MHIGTRGSDLSPALVQHHEGELRRHLEVCHARVPGSRPGQSQLQPVAHGSGSYTKPWVPCVPAKAVGRVQRGWLQGKVSFGGSGSSLVMKMKAWSMACCLKLCLVCCWRHCNQPWLAVGTHGHRLGGSGTPLGSRLYLALAWPGFWDSGAAKLQKPPDLPLMVSGKGRQQI